MDYDGIYLTVFDKLFPDQEVRAEVEKILSAYGTKSFQRQEARIRLAILKVAGTDLAEIEKYTEFACGDYRDMLCLAEYPNQSRRWTLRDENPKRYKELIQKDLKQYQEWIERVDSM
jgi:hypothetical protein